MCQNPRNCILIRCKCLTQDLWRARSVPCLPPPTSRPETFAWMFFSFSYLRVRKHFLLFLKPLIPLKWTQYIYGVHRTWLCKLWYVWKLFNFSIFPHRCGIPIDLDLNKQICSTRRTEKSDSENFRLSVLQNHDVACDANEALAGFELRTDYEVPNGHLWFEYVCCNLE